MDATWITSGLDGLMAGDAGAYALSSDVVILAMLLSFCIGHVIAWIYVWTHEGLSYSRMFAGSLLAMPVIVCLVMLLMAGNLIIAFGLLAVFTVVRFRNVLKDTRDTTFILWVIIEGMACGTMKFGLAVLGCAVIAAVFLYLKLTAFGGRHRYDAILTVQVLLPTGALPAAGHFEQDADDDDELTTEKSPAGIDDTRLRQVLRRHALRAQLTSRREINDTQRDQTYQLVLRDPSRSRELLHELEGTKGVLQVALYRREEESEV